ncbi:MULTISPECIES: hypothetical protein [unclassified Rathayibacter]|jgi:hypothetical protein|uniref:hypothetical protein n=1 Tax=unclassified Rathayibacter TaxID=2609250 RepID=UPI000CE8585A|nr:MULTISPECIES: hypothetical protein [unclassified Rathayibacter]PPF37761.1 hypothetical protein C5C10_05205 [Rathayibacter sp. AY1A3]PPG17194.1 hypothetical protein C5D36_04840 [Rathayibacter sp. AY1C6]PPG31015.1 hypothetical protein C5C25_08605 [Rathayibacter sp. AY2B9]PPG62191.1 hypothetical protein C5C69_06340 [Rathayibacter sp. AY1C7]PPH07996.1 hypothetical protein C5C33_06260 [Rathayibacter sp. AY1H3]
MSVPTSTAGHFRESDITPESFETERLERRLALLEASIAQGERALLSRVDPSSGAPLPGACGGHRAQLVSNLTTERALADRIREMLAARS